MGAFALNVWIGYSTFWLKQIGYLAARPDTKIDMKHLRQVRRHQAEALLNLADCLRFVLQET